MSTPTTDLAPLNIMRTETVLSKFPIHNLSSSKRVDINITKQNEQGQLELYWQVSANEQYGFPGQLAYKLDTIIINQRIDALGRPLPRIIRLGSVSEICRVFGIPDSGKNLRDLRKAILQNAFVAITANLTYKGTDGTERRLEAAFTRYSVVFTGERLPNGKKADAVYLVLNDIYLELLNHAPFRPLDYDYLKGLKPTAQRFYEIISYRIFPAIKYQLPHAKILYSEYCTLSTQQRYYDYDHFKKQMYKVHKPHLDSCYIEKVSYDATEDGAGKPDWMMCYIPGAKAHAEYQACNSKQLIEGEAREVMAKLAKANTARAQKKVAPQRTAKPAATAPTHTSPQPNAKSAPTVNEAARQLVQYFHQQARQVDNYQPGSRELSQAQAIIDKYGPEQAKFAVTFAVQEARKTNFQMRTFGALRQYVHESLVEYKAMQRQEAIQREQAAQARQQVDARLKAMPPQQYRTLYEQIKQQLLSDMPALQADTLELFVKDDMIRRLYQQELKEG